MSTVRMSHKEFWRMVIVIVSLWVVLFVVVLLWYGGYRERQGRQCARDETLQSNTALQLQYNNIPYCWVYGSIVEIEYSRNGLWKPIKK